MDDSQQSRRRFLALTGGASLLGLAGCVTGDKEREPSERTREYFSADMNRELPEGYEDCVGIDGDVRDPDNVSPKEEVSYQFHPNYGDGQRTSEMCANCRYFCPGSGGSRAGGCTEVAGGIRSQDWCGLWQPTEELERLREERSLE